jgi:hypothetical protein
MKYSYKPNERADGYLKWLNTPKVKSKARVKWHKRGRLNRIWKGHVAFWIDFDHFLNRL